MQGFLNAVTGIANESGFVGIMENPGYLIMIIVACGLIYLAIGKQFEPLLLLPIAFGMLLANLPFGEIIHMQYFIPPEGADPLPDSVVVHVLPPPAECLILEL